VPPTIDLQATEVDAAADRESADRDLKGAEAPESTASAAPPAETATADAATGETARAAAAESPMSEPGRQARESLPASEEAGAAPMDREGGAPALERDSLDIASRATGTQTDAAIDAPRDEPRRRTPIGALAAAGLIGGLVGAGLLYGLQTWRSTQAQTDPRLVRIEQQLGTLAPQENVRSLDGRLGSLETAHAGLSRRVEAAQALAERSAARAEEAVNRPAAPASSQDNTAVSDLSNRLGSLEAQLRQDVQAASGATQALERRLGEQDQRVAAAIQTVERRATELEQLLGTATQPLERRLTELEQRLAALNRQVAEGGSDATRAGTRVVLAERLHDALRDGAPYADVLAGLRRFTPDAGKLAPLDAYAEGGAPSAAALAQGFRPIGERLRREARQGSEDWTDRLLRMADKVVTVRALDEPGATGVPATVARIEDALARGSISDAAAAWESLPDAARQASGEWGQQLRQRAEAEAAARTVAAEAVAALNQATR
jgi:hypothetical protein